MTRSRRSTIRWIAGMGAGTLAQSFWLPQPSQAQSRRLVGHFSSNSPGGDLPADWEKQTFQSIPNHTEYTLVEDSGLVVVRATSEAASSGLTRRTTIDLNEFPMLQWRWKVTDPVEQSDLRDRDGDACSARVYVTFGQTLFSTRAINYVWTANIPTGELITSPITDRVRLYVQQNESSPLDEWITEERNVLADFREAFGGDPPPISGVAILTDGYRTGERAEAFYGDIAFLAV